MGADASAFMTETTAAAGGATRANYREFADREVRKYAAECDATARVPASVLKALAQDNWFGLGLSQRWGGQGVDEVEYGIALEELARASASVHGIVNVHHMAARAIQRWGSGQLKEQWLPALASGDALAGVAITEPGVGSDAAAVETSYRREGAVFELSGHKKWITAAGRADLFLVLANGQQGPTAFVVPRKTAGLRIEPIEGMHGCRGYMLGELDLRDAVLPVSAVVGRLGVGLSHVMAVALDVGRYGIAWGCTGVGQACLDASVEFANVRRQFGTALVEHQLVARLLARMAANVLASRGISLEAGRLRATSDPNATFQTHVAKYFAARELASITTDAVQVHGAQGCQTGHLVERCHRDARIMEIIEGTTQMNEIWIARHLGGAISSV